MRSGILDLFTPQVVGDDNAIEPVHLTTSETSSDVMITRMGVLYDPTAGLRMRFLKKKFAYLLSGFRAIKQAAYKPFIRCRESGDLLWLGYLSPDPPVLTLQWFCFCWWWWCCFCCCCCCCFLERNK